MEEKELALLNEIDQLHEKLISEPGGTYNLALKKVMPPSGYTYAWNARSLRDKVIQIHKEFAPDYIDTLTIQQLYHTCENEVDFVERQQEKVNNPRSSKRSKDELERLMRKATQQIELDMFSLFKKIEELKNNNQ